MWRLATVLDSTVQDSKDNTKLKVAMLQRRFDSRAAVGRCAAAVQSFSKHSNAARIGTLRFFPAVPFPS